MMILYSILCVACLCIGFFVGYKIKQKEGKTDNEYLIKQLKRKPDIKKIRENQELEEQTRQYMERYSTILDNINNYDGSSNNQRKVS